MAQRKSKRSRLPLLALLLLLLLGFMLPSGFLAGILDGGGRHDTDETLEVTVLSAGSRAPILGARILVAGLRPRESDAAGQVVLDGLPAGPFRVDIAYEGKELTTWARRSEGRIVVELAPDSLRVGTLKNAAGEPMAGTVRLLDRDGHELARITTDADGRYELPDHARAATVCGEGPGASPAVAARGDIVVTEGETIRGRLLGATAGDLMVFGQMPEPDDDGMLPFHCVWTLQADGSYAGRLGPGVRAWATWNGLPIRLIGGDQKLPTRIDATGVVRRADGNPAPRATLIFRVQLDADFPVPLPPVRIVANDAGRFSAPDFADVRYTVEVSAAGCANRVLRETRPRDLLITLEPGYSAAGRVVDADGTPIVGAEIRALSQPDPTGRHPMVHTQSGARGRFLLEGLGGEFARVQVSATGFLPATIDRVEPASITKAVLKRG